MRHGNEGDPPPRLLVEYDLLDLGTPCAFFRGDGRVGLGEDGDVVGHGRVSWLSLSASRAGRGYPRLT